MATKFVTLEVEAEIREGHTVELLIDGQFCDGWEFTLAQVDRPEDLRDARAWVDRADLEERAENEWRQCRFDEK